MLQLRELIEVNKNEYEMVAVLDYINEQDFVDLSNEQTSSELIQKLLLEQIFDNSDLEESYPSAPDMTKAESKLRIILYLKLKPQGFIEGQHGVFKITEIGKEYINPPLKEIQNLIDELLK